MNHCRFVNVKRAAMYNSSVVMNQHYTNGKMKIEVDYQHPHLQLVQNDCHSGNNSSHIQQRQTSTTPNIYPTAQLITGAEWQAIANNTIRSRTQNGYYEYSAEEIIGKPKEMIHNNTLPHLSNKNNFYFTNQLINENGDSYMHLNFLCTQMLNVLKDSIEFSKKQIDTMLTDHAADKNFSQLADYEILYQVKPAQHRLRQLQLQLIAIQELKGKYLNTLTMNRTAVKCELDKPARRTVQRLKKARNRFANITQDLAKLQAETEVYMGSLIFQPKGIVGFARITCGDEFELVIKHGSQKAKMRTKIGKDRVQIWNPSEAIFKCFLGEIFELKVYEIKSLGKRQLLDTYFYYVELICSQPTALTIDLKRSGTVKLYLVINWDPLDFSGKSHGNCGVHSVRWKSLTSFGRSKQSRPKSLISSFSPKDQRSTNIIRSASACGTVQTTAHIPRIKSQTNIAETSNTDPLLYTLDKMVYCSKQLLQKYPQLNNLYNTLHLLKLKIQESTMQCITSNNTNKPTDCIANRLSKMHMSDARTEDTLKTRVSSNRLSMHESSLRTLNSTVASDSFYHQSENTKFMCSMEAKLRESPFLNRITKASPSELRTTVKHHLVHVQLLIQQLDKVGPMKAKEAEALRKITEENQILKLITKLSDDHLCLPSVSDILGDLDTSVELQNIWLAACCKANRYLLPLLQLSNEISQLYGTTICSYYPGMLDKVMASMRHMLTDESTWLPHEVTVFQFVGFFKNQHLSVFMENLSHETWINEGLKSRNIKEIQITLDRLKQQNTLPPTNCLRYIAMLLVDEQSELYSASENYLHSINNNNNSTRGEMINQYIGILEHDDPMSRRGACRALALLNAENAIELLVFLSSHDHNPMVRNEARNSLFNFGISKL
ncbi:Protein FAM65C [Trichinella pseudospiralis]|uniref:Protein FAM65C n=1 Tax=Trichinella pseudospiralis TaxID=6337 RepID=A0A0V1FVC1_TRIPS|nr:Protein FAM65C [Trichinella pseudospiralis]